MRLGAGTRLRSGRAIIPLLFVVALSACKSASPPVVVTPGAPQFPDFIYPAVTANDTSPLGSLQQQAWKYLQAGDLRNAERGFNDLLKQRPAFAPAETG